MNLSVVEDDISVAERLREGLTRQELVDVITALAEREGPRRN